MTEQIITTFENISNKTLAFSFNDTSTISKYTITCDIGTTMSWIFESTNHISLDSRNNVTWSGSESKEFEVTTISGLEYFNFSFETNSAWPCIKEIALVTMVD